MKLSQIALAVASLSAVPALAATGSLQSLYGVSPANTVFISGSSSLTGLPRDGSVSSQSGPLVAAVAALCGGGNASIRTLTIDTQARFGSYSREIDPQTPGSISDGYVIVCTTNCGYFCDAFTAPYAVVKRETNGSFDGVGPVINQSGLTKWADIRYCDNVANKCALDITTVRVPHAGLTDVDTNVWVGMANTGALSIPVPPLGTTVASGGFAGQGFGVMVSESLYNAMMAKQVAEGRLPATAGTASCVAGNFTPGACQPSISKEEYAAIVDAGNFAYVANGAISGDTGVINLCRRVETSGTQATSNVYFLNNSCGNADPTTGFKAPKKVDFTSATAVAWDSSAGDQVTGNWDDNGGAFGLFEGSGTGDARNCVIRRNAGKNPNNVADTLGTYAIGWISLSNTPYTSDQHISYKGWRLLKLDGVSPNAVQVPVGSADDNVVDIYSPPGAQNDGWAQDYYYQRINVVKGYYDAAPELEMLWPANTGYSTFLNVLKNTLANPTKINARGLFQANSASFTHATYPTQVHKGTRNGSFCTPQVLGE